MRPALALLPLLAAACAPTEAVVYDGDFALDFTEGSCVVATGDPVTMGTELTVEAWVRASTAPAQYNAAVVRVGSAATLWADDGGTGFSRPDQPGTTGWQTSVSLFDGELHHVAATWRDQEGGSLFIDGLRSGHGTPWDTLPGFDTVRIGCHELDEQNFEGVIDEVRVSRVVRYDTNFEVRRQPFQHDVDTIAIWHLNTGTGDVALEARDRFLADIEDAEWVPGLINTAE